MLKRPDITPAQIKADVILACTILSSVGLTIDDQMQGWLTAAITGAVAAYAIGTYIADALIRRGRAAAEASMENAKTFAPSPTTDVKS